MKRILITNLICFSLLLTNCSAIAEVISAITSVDCDDWLLEEISQDLSDECSDLDGYLETDTTDLVGLAGDGLSQVMSTGSLASDLVLMQLTDSTGSALTDVAVEDVTASFATDGENFEAVEVDSIDKLSEVEGTQASIALLIDYSGSIGDSDLDDVNSGLAVFFENLEVGYQGAVIKFSSSVDIIQDFTTTEADLLTAVNDTSYTRQATSMYDGIVSAVNATKDETTNLKMVLLFTDGLDNDSSATQAEAIALAQENEIPICVIGVSFANTTTLETIASETGCFYVYKTLFSSLDDAFETFADQINNLQMVSLSDSFDETSGTLKLVVDAGEDTSREITQAIE
jgi:uncharacterized protein YegL